MKLYVKIIIAILVNMNFEILLSNQEISADRLWSMIQNKKKKPSDDLIVINVLNKNAYRDCHIKNSINLPLHALKAHAQKRRASGRWKKDKSIVVYCADANCPLSRYAYRMLTDERSSAKLGFTNVFHYRGGMKDWMQHDYPNVGQACGDYLKS